MDKLNSRYFSIIQTKIQKEEKLAQEIRQAIKENNYNKNSDKL